MEVDLDTGHITVLRLWSANDVGKAINPQQVEGQIEGAVAQSVGWTIQEDFKQANGRVLTDQLSTYLIPTVLDVPVEMLPDRSGISRSARATGRSRHGRDALHPHRSRHRRRRTRRHRRLVPRPASHARTVAMGLI